MHPLMLQKVIATCRERIAQGDCPTTPPFSVEQLEDAVIELAKAREPVAQQPPRSRMCIWSDCDLDAIYCEGHAKEAFAPYPIQERKLTDAEMDSLTVPPGAFAAAQQPPSEPPQQIEHCNDWADLLERSGWFPGLVRTLRESAARIESDAERIRELEAEKVAAREWHAGDCYICHHDAHRQSLCSRCGPRCLQCQLAASRERERALIALLDSVEGDPAFKLLDEELADEIDRVITAAVLATPDSAASPTGGEG